VSGTLAGAATTWSGIVRVTGDLTVPPGHLLTVQPGTLVLLDGNATPLSTTGTDLIVGTRRAEDTPTTAVSCASWAPPSLSTTATSPTTAARSARPPPRPARIPK
jgi:hypothetical protein